MSEPTIVIGKLDDKELRSSIDELVNYVKSQAEAMAASFNTPLREMQDVLKGFKETKVGSTRSGGLKDEEQSVKSVAESYDQLAKAKKQAIGVDVPQEQVSAQEQLNKKIQRQAEIIRERMQAQGTNFATFGNQVFYQQGTNKEARNIEQQLLDAHNAAIRSAQERVAAEQRVNQTIQEGVILAQQQAQAEQQVTNATQQRSNTQPKRFEDYEDFRQALGHVLKLQANEIQLTNEDTASYQRLQVTLKQLQEAYNKLDKKGRDSEMGKTLVASMQEVERAMQKIQQQAKRPVSLKQILDIEPKTLDNIADKIRQLQAYRQGINFTAPNAEKEIQQVNAAITQLQARQKELLGQNKGLLASNNALARSFNYIKNRLAFVLTVSTTTSFVKQIYDIRAQYELLERSIGILYDSMQEGSRIFAELNAMAIKSPFTTMELGAAAKQLSAYDVAAKDVVDTTRRLADIAAAVGIPIERLTYALGQIKSYEYLNSRDARMFMNAGIPLVKNLADMYSKLEGRLVSVGDVYDRIKKKAVSYEDVMSVINQMTDEGGRFFNYQEKAADSLKIKLANLRLAYNNMLNQIGKGNQGALSALVDIPAAVFNNWRTLNNILVSMLYTFGLMKTTQAAYIYFLRGASLRATIAATTTSGFARSLVQVKSAMMALATNPMTWIFAVTSALITFVFTLQDAADAAKMFGEAISKNAEENSKKITKFLDEYSKEAKRISSKEEQQKLWERTKEEIEETSKAAERYIGILENIPDVNKRIEKSIGFLEQQKAIEAEAKRLTESGVFTRGTNDYVIDNILTKLGDYQNELIDITEEYGTLNNAMQQSGIYATIYQATFAGSVRSVKDEFHRLRNILYETDFDKVLGSGSIEEQLANLQAYANIWRDNLLMTEKGQKLNTEGRAKLNAEFDKFVAVVARGNNLIDEERYAIEANRSAWETFFSQLSNEEREAVDYLVSTNQTSSREFQKIWDNAAERMKKSSMTAYDAIQEQIAKLRETPDIVINVVYKTERETLDDQQKQFKKEFLTPKHGLGVLPFEKWNEEQQKLTKRYGRFQKKQGEDNVEWEKRLGEEYVANEKKIKALNNQLTKKNNLSEADLAAKKHDLDLLTGTNKALDDIAKKQGFDYKQFGKGGSKGTKKDVLGEALQKEVELVNNITKKYKEYRDTGVSSTDAIDKTAQEYNKTLTNTNKTLADFGIKSTKTVREIANMPLRDVVSYLQTLLKGAQAQGNAKGIEAIEKAIANLNVEITKTDYKQFKESLDSSLTKINDQYELAIDLEANPELGESFMKAFGIVPEQLPRTLKQYADSVLAALNKYFKDTNQSLELPTLQLSDDDLRYYAQQVQNKELTQDAYDAIVKAVENYRTRFKKASDDNIKDWNKLIAKYGELQNRIYKIQQETADERLSFIKQFSGDNDEVVSTAISLKTQLDTEEDPTKRQGLIDDLKSLTQELAGTDGARIRIKTSIDKSEVERIAHETFEDFQKEPEWLISIGDLSGMTHKALGILIKDLQEFKKNTQGLSEKDLKRLTKAIATLQKQQRKDSPFSALVDSIKQARDRVEPLRTKLKALEEEYEKLSKATDKGNNATEAQKERLEKLGQQIADTKAKMKALSQLSAKEVVDALQKAYGAIQPVIGGIGDMFAAFGNEDAANAIKAFEATIDKGMQFAQLGAMVGGVWGAAIGGIIGGLMGLFTSLADIISGNAAITEQVEDSERAVKRLENRYKRLEHAIEQAFGAEEVGLKASEIANKRLQLQETQRQLQLEQRRTSKYRDEDKIIDLEGRIIDLEQEIQDLEADAINNLLGISSVSDAVEDMVGTIIDSLRNGEDAMSNFNESINEMIANMIKQVFSAKVLGPMFQSIWDNIEEQILGKSELQRAAEYLDIYQKRLDQVVSQNGKGWLFYRHTNGSYYQAKTDSDFETFQKQYLGKRGGGSNYTQATYEEWKAYMDKLIEEQKEKIDELSIPTMDDIKTYAEQLRGVSPEVSGYIDTLQSILQEMGLIKDTTKDKTLSLLQQGIQGITEDTAGALEGMLNGMSQQVYLQSNLMTQIRDTLVSFDSDAQLGTLGEMLLQLQISTQTQNAIKSILEGTLNPSGRAIMVELNA